MREVANVNAMAMGGYGQMQMQKPKQNRKKRCQIAGGEALQNKPTVAARETLPISSGRRERSEADD